MLGQLRQDFLHRPVEIDAHNICGNLAAILFRNEPAWIAFQFFKPDPVAVDLRLDVAVGGTRNAHTHGTGRAMPGQTNNPHVQREILAAELRAVT
jgi:hypothetical protein